MGVGDVHMEVEGCACVERFPTLHTQSYTSDIMAPHTLVSVSGWYSSHSNRSCLVLRDSELMHTAGKHWEAVVGIQHSQRHLRENNWTAYSAPSHEGYISHKTQVIH